MIELCYSVSDKRTGIEVCRGCGKFESLDSFYAYMKLKYGYSSHDHSFMLSGRKIS